MNNQYNNRTPIENAVLTGDYPGGFTFKDLRKAKCATFGGKPLAYAVGFKNYPLGTTRRDLKSVLNNWPRIPRSAWDDLMGEVANKEKLSPGCVGRMAKRIIAVPDVVFVLRPLESKFHAEVLDWLFKRMNVHDTRIFTNRVKKFFAANEQVFLYLLQNYPHIAKCFFPFRKPRTQAVRMVRRRLCGPVVGEQSIKCGSQNSHPKAFAEMILQYPILLKGLHHKKNKFHKKIWQYVFSSKPMSLETRDALAATRPDAMTEFL